MAGSGPCFPSGLCQGSDEVDVCCVILVSFFFSLSCFLPRHFSFLSLRPSSDLVRRGCSVPDEGELVKCASR
jgi:hypothetical protein